MELPEVTRLVHDHSRRKEDLAIIILHLPKVEAFIIKGYDF